jgi:hypothetical protein
MKEAAIEERLRWKDGKKYAEYTYKVAVAGKTGTVEYTESELIAAIKASQFVLTNARMMHSFTGRDYIRCTTETRKWTDKAGVEHIRFLTRENYTLLRRSEIKS